MGPTFVQLSANSVPTGRPDVDIAGLQFDPTGLYGGHLILADCDANSDNRAAIYALLPNLTWQAISSLVTTPVRCYGDLTISPGGALGQSIYVTEKVTNTITTVAPNGTHSVWASGFVGIESISAASDGESLYVSDFNGVYRIRPTGNVPGPVLIAREPSLPGTQPFKTTDPIYSARLIWNAPIFFGNSDVVVTNAKGEDVPVSVSGSGSQFLLISFGTPLYTNTYTITVRDTVRSVTGSIQIDGDNNGISGGDAVIQMMHLCPSDVNNNGIVNSQDFFDFLTAFFTPELCSDFNGDGFANSQDFYDFHSAF
ncbi:MAG: hypothetical protein H7X97_09855, partial [Opitutaceae bacterium]|nr:hypothetical protein [Verrucomicrobiales bacterium]